MRSLILASMCVLGGCTMLSGFDDFTFEESSGHLDSSFDPDAAVGGTGGAGGSDMAGFGGAGGEDAGMAGSAGLGGTGGEAGMAGSAGAGSGGTGGMTDPDASVDSGTDAGTPPMSLEHQCSSRSTTQTTCPPGYLSRFTEFDWGVYPPANVYHCMLEISADEECPADFGLYKIVGEEAGAGYGPGVWCSPASLGTVQQRVCEAWLNTYGDRL